MLFAWETMDRHYYYMTNGTENINHFDIRSLLFHCNMTNVFPRIRAAQNEDDCLQMHSQLAVIMSVPVQWGRLKQKKKCLVADFCNFSLKESYCSLWPLIIIFLLLLDWTLHYVILNYEIILEIEFRYEGKQAWRVLVPWRIHGANSPFCLWTTPFCTLTGEKNKLFS